MTVWATREVGKGAAGAAVAQYLDQIGPPFEFVRAHIDAEHGERC